MKFAISWCCKELTSLSFEGVGRSNGWRCKCGPTSNQPYDCGADFQTIKHVQLIIVQWALSRGKERLNKDPCKQALKYFSTSDPVDIIKCLNENSISNLQSAQYS